MLSATREFARKHHPEKYVRTLKHVGLWFTSTSSDVIEKNPAADAKEADIGIYCIHGTADRNGSFSVLAKKMLSRNGGLSTQIASIHLLAFERRGVGISIKFFAYQLLEKIKQNNHKKVILMGHSRGGVVSAYFAENLAKEAGIQVLLVMPICSPFDGSALSFLLSGVSDSMHELEQMSAFLVALNKKIAKSEIPYFYIAADDDMVVAPKACCVPEHKDFMRTISNEAHLSIMSSDKLADLGQIKINGLIAPTKDESISYSSKQRTPASS